MSATNLEHFPPVFKTHELRLLHRSVGENGTKKKDCRDHCNNASIRVGWISQLWAPPSVITAFSKAACCGCSGQPCRAVFQSEHLNKGLCSQRQSPGRVSKFAGNGGRLDRRLTGGIASYCCHTPSRQVARNCAVQVGWETASNASDRRMKRRKDCSRRIGRARAGRVKQ